ncbi:MAG: hypothetical protein KBH86_13050 [Syntrophorhabdus sp.]|nr:hypothetical protein [Syntrophorhabdus sp.]
MNNEFNEPPEELRHIAEEIGLLRKDIQTASATLGRIERRLKAAFPNYPVKKKEPKKNRTERTVSLKTAQELQSIFDDLVAQTQNNGDSGFATKIDQMSDEDIVALAIEVGASSKNRLSRNKATEGVRKRVQEAMQLQFERKTIPQQKNPADG